MSIAITAFDIHIKQEVDVKQSVELEKERTFPIGLIHFRMSIDFASHPEKYSLLEVER